MIYIFQYNTFKAVGGEQGNADGEVVIIRLCNYIFTEQLLSNVTWTGKCGKKDKKKISFKSFEQINDLICNLSNAADQKIDKNSYQQIIVYKVLKYAYKKTPVIESGNKIEVVETVDEIGNDDIFIIVPNDANGAENTSSQVIATNSMNPSQHNVQYLPQYQVIQSVPSGQPFQSIQQNHPYLMTNHVNNNVFPLMK